MELVGSEARGFVFVEDIDVRPILLGSFAVNVPNEAPFFVSVVVNENKTDSFQFFVMEKRKGSPTLGTSNIAGTCLRWRYSPTKQSGDNAARKQAFVAANGSDTIDIPLPDHDIMPFATAIRRAITQRHLADGDVIAGEPAIESGAGKRAILDELFPNAADRVIAAQAMARAILVAHRTNPKSWCVTQPNEQKLIRLNVGMVRVLNLRPGRVELAVDGHKLGADTHADLEIDMDKENIQSLPENGVVRFSPAAMATVPGVVQAAHEAFIVAAAARASSFSWAHRPEIVDQIARLAGMALPRPEFDGSRSDNRQRDVLADRPVNGVSFGAILSHLKSRSLSFSAETVATYLLALQARRFVLLTGISGTGKTQLALEVARLFAPEAPATRQQGAADAVEMVIQIDHVKRGRFVVPARLSKQLDALYDEDRKRIDVRLPGRQAESMAIYKDAERPSLLMVLFSGEAKTSFQKTSSVGDRVLLRREVSGKNETLVVELPQGQAPLVLREPTHELVAVRPDWTDARALVGFYNPLTRGYISTPTLDLLQKAQAEVERSSAAGLPPRPYFLVFDEMNLARVEHYFSDFLSAMESGEEIHLHDDDELAEADDNPVPKRIRIPTNIFVVGTVNIDETTYMFSPKVLDRAFVLEFNHVDLDSLGGQSTLEDPASTPLSLTRMEAGLKLLGRSDAAEWMRFEAALDGELARQLKKLHAALTADNRHFGYRVAREIARFVDLAGEQSAGSPGALRAAFDIAVFSKVLPKLHGGQAEIEGPLARLFAVAIGSEATSEDVKQLDRFILDGNQLKRVDAGGDLPMPRTALKLWRMRQRLRAQGFVSFIE